jgi:hypothetical protein
MLWVDVLNRALGWDEEAILRAFLAEIAPGADWTPKGAAALRADVALLRAAAAGRLLADRVAAPAVNQWIASVTLWVTTPERRAGFLLPPLRAARTRTALPAAVEELLSTALVDLAARPALEGAVARCAGVVRSGAGRRSAVFGAVDAEFAQRAGLGGLPSPEWCQCARFVAGPRSGQYCGKACANAAFAFRKAAREPDYFARKQATYRNRKRQRGAAASVRPEGAFAFVD